MSAFKRFCRAWPSIEWTVWEVAKKSERERRRERRVWDRGARLNFNGATADLM